MDEWMRGVGMGMEMGRWDEGRGEDGRERKNYEVELK